MNSCEKIQEMISSMLDGELSAADETLVREHIAQCEECAAMYEDFLALSNELNKELSEVPASLHSRIMKGVRTSNKPKKPFLISMRPYIGAAACLVIVAGVVLAAQGGRLGADMALVSNSKQVEMPAAPAAPELYSFDAVAECEEEAEQYMAPETPAEPERPAEPQAPAEPEMPAGLQEPAFPTDAGAGEDKFSNTVTATDDRNIIVSDYDVYIPGAEIDEAWMVIWFDDVGLVEYRAISDPAPLKMLLEDTPASADPTAIEAQASALLKLYADGAYMPVKLYFTGEFAIAETGCAYYIPAGTPEDFLSLGSVSAEKNNQP